MSNQVAMCEHCKCAHVAELRARTLCKMMQAAALEQARGLAAQLLVRCEQARGSITAAAADYRRLFAWLLQCTRRLDEGRRQPGG